MSLLTLEESNLYESTCKKLLENEEIQFAGFVSKLGRMIAGGFGNDFFIRFEDNELEVFLMETALEFSMKNEFNKKFGTIEYVFSKRNSENITCIPVHDNVLVIITKNHVEIQQTIEKCRPIIQKALENDNLQKSLR